MTNDISASKTLNKNNLAIILKFLIKATIFGAHQF